MDKQKTEYIVAGVLVLVLLIALINGVMSVSKSKKRAKAAKEPDQAQQSTSGIGSGATDIAEGISIPAALKKDETRQDLENLNWSLDPFNYQREIQPKESTIGSLNVEGIIWDPITPYAIINDKIVKTGDVIDSFKILEIKKRSIVVEKDAQVHELLLDADI